MRLLWIAAIACTACSEPPAAPPVPVAAPAEPAAPVAPAEPALETIRQTSALVTFEHDVLVECTQADVVAVPGAEPGAWPPSLPRLGGDGDLPEGRMRIARGCLEQFPDRVVVGRCVETTSATGGRGTFSTTTTRFFYSATDDGRMRHCMERGGEWSDR